LAKCSGITRAGTACKGIPIEGSEYCYAHVPDRLDERRRNGSKGGRRGGRGRPMTEIADIKRRLSALAEGVLEGAINRADAAVVSQIFNVHLRAVSVELKAREQEELVGRLEELEEALERRREDRRYGAS
jgi:hypothetical protein